MNRSYHKGYRKLLGVENFIEAYIQSTILKRTFESISVDFRRGSTLVGGSKECMLDAAVERLYAQCG